MRSKSLASAVEALDRRILEDPAVGPDLFRRMLEEERAGGLLHGDRPICPFLRPLVIGRSEYDEVARAAETLAFAFERLAAAALADEEVMSLLGLTELEESMARVDPGYERLCVSSRLDAFLTADGFKFLEYNAESPAGIGDQILLDRILFSLPHMREFLDERPHARLLPHRRLLEALVGGYRAWGGTKERPRVAIVDWKGVPTESEFRILASYFESEGYPTVVADPGELRYTDGTLRAGAGEVDILYKRVIIHELLERTDDSDPIRRAYLDGRVFMANSFRSKLVHKKASLAVLTDSRFAHHFTGEQLATIERHVPWTRVVREGAVTIDGADASLRELVLADRERFVLKPNDDYGGHGIAVGFATSDEEWSEAVERAFRAPYVVQERVTPEPVRIPAFEGGGVEMLTLLTDFDPFLFDNRVEGGLVRLSASALCNVSSGGGETGLLVVEED